MKKYGALVIMMLVALIVTGCGCAANNKIANVELGDYKGLEVSLDKIVVTDEDIDHAVIDILIEDQENVKITNRPVRRGDIVDIDYDGTVDGVAFTGGTGNKGDLTIGSGYMIPGFEEQIIGMKHGQTADIKVTFPADYDEELAGKEAVFKIKINSITGKVLPSKVTDALVAEKTDYETVEELREYMRGELQAEADSYNETNLQDAVWNLVKSKSKVENISKRKIAYYEDLYEKSYQEYADMFGITLAEFSDSYLGITADEFEKYKTEYAEAVLTDLAIARMIAEKEGIEVTDKEYDEYLADYTFTDEEKKEFRDAVMDELLFYKVLEFVSDSAKVTWVTE